MTVIPFTPTTQKQTKVPHKILPYERSKRDECFKCRKPGHMIKDCRSGSMVGKKGNGEQNKGNGKPKPKKKLGYKDLKTHIRTLIDENCQGDKEQQEFLDFVEKEGF